MRAREAAADDLRRKRQQLLSFRFDIAGFTVETAIGRWPPALAGRSESSMVQQIVFQEGIHAIEDALQRLRRLEKQLALIVPEWSIAPVVEAYQAMRGDRFSSP